MLYFPNSRIELSTERPVKAGVTIAAEGLALTADYTGGVFGAKPSTTGAGEIFIGVSINRPINIVSRPNMEAITIPVGAAAQLQFAPLSGTIVAINTATNVPLTLEVGAPGAPAQYQVDTVNPLQLNFWAADAGNNLTVAYQYAPTIAQSVAIMGMQDPGGPAGAYLGQVGVITRGDVYTDQYDTTANWGVSAPVMTLGANGQFTIGGAVKVPGYIIQVPVVGTALLGFHFDAV